MTDVVIPASRSWPDMILRRWYSTHRQAWRHHATLVCQGFGLLGFGFHHLIILVEVGAENHLSRLNELG